MHCSIILESRRTHGEQLNISLYQSCSDAFTIVYGSHTKIDWSVLFWGRNYYRYQVCVWNFLHHYCFFLSILQANQFHG